MARNPDRRKGQVKLRPPFQWFGGHDFTPTPGYGWGWPLKKEFN